MSIWILGVCKRPDCRWATARIREDEFTTTEVTGEMIQHSERSGHACKQMRYNSAEGRLT